MVSIKQLESQCLETGLFENCFSYRNDTTTPKIKPILNEIYDFFGVSSQPKDINKEVSKLFLGELFGQGYPIPPDDPVKEKDVDWSDVTKKKNKKKTSVTTSLDRTNSIAGTGPGREFTIRGDGSSSGAFGGLGDPQYRESVSINKFRNKRLSEEEDGLTPDFGDMGSSHKEPMETPGSKVIANLKDYDPQQKKKKTIKELLSGKK